MRQSCAHTSNISNHLGGTGEDYDVVDGTSLNRCSHVPMPTEGKEGKKTEKQKSDTKHKHDLCLMKNILLMAIFITVSQGQKMNRNLGLAVMAGS